MRLIADLPIAFCLIVASTLPADQLRAAEAKAVTALRREVAHRGWLVFSAHPAEVDGRRIIQDADQRGPLDLYLSRPDGSHLRNITRTAAYHEYGARFSPDGTQLLFRRLDKSRHVDHDLWGAFGQLIIANADGSGSVAQGDDGQYPWASWSPDATRIACLYKKEGRIRIVELKSKQVVRELPSFGIYQQLFWSPDGKRLCGTANLARRKWNVISVDLQSARPTPLTRALSCTPDWFQNDSNQVIYSNRNPALFPGKYDNYGLTMIMRASADGQSRKLVYGNAGKHCYFGCTSPDGQYVVFADEPRDTIVVGEMRLLRLADTPILPPALGALKLLYPDAKEGPVLDLRLPGGVPLRGFEPHWTYAAVEAQP